MPELLEAPGSAGAVVIEGAYAVLVRREAQHQTEVDPRLLLSDQKASTSRNRRQ